MCEYADVAVPVAVRRTFVYAVPAPLRTRLQAGMRVLVPFGRKALTGIVVAPLQARPEGDFKIRPLRALLDDRPIIPPDLIATALWVAEQYFTYPGEVLRTLFPAGSQPSAVQRVSLTPKAAELAAGGFRPQGLRPQEYVLLETLAAHGPMSPEQLKGSFSLRGLHASIEALCAAGWARMEAEPLKPRVRAKEQLGIRPLAVSQEILSSLPEAQRRICRVLGQGALPRPLQEVLCEAEATVSSARRLEERGFIEIAAMQIHRIPLDLSVNPDRRILVLTDAQSRALTELLEMLRRRSSARCLLHGVTGSGKTEIYLRLIAEVVKDGGTALFLVPEIGLTPLLSRLALSHFPDQVALFHSGMSAGERYDQWERIRRGQAPVVVGTRSAVFAPLENLRLAIIDEEQDSSYKQDEAPCYHAREVAWQRIRSSGGVLLLGSATPSVETYHAAASGSMHILRLPERIEARPLPAVNLVDMSLEFQRRGRKTVISELLLSELRERLRREEQAIVLLNRRGYAHTLLCRSCGQAFSCPDCSVSMPFHHRENLLLCHYCGRQEQVPSTCPSCGGEYIYFVGVGTEQLEELLRSLLPGARIARVDRDATRRRGALRRILLDFSDHKLDLLVGTQMLAKGHDFPNVTLVGVLAADAGLSFPDFRSAERTFQLLTQVAGRAGRGKIPGQVIVQAFYPDHYALQFARKQDYEGFFARESDYRRLLGYPPFRSLVQILVVEASREKAVRIGERIAVELKTCARQVCGEDRIVVLGPAPAPLEKLRSKFRIQLLIKGSPGEPALPVLRAAFENLAQSRVGLKNVLVDVDPLSLL